MRTTRTTALLLAVGLAAAACGDQPTAPEDTVDPSFARGLDGASPGWSGFPVFTDSQLRRAFPGSPCMDEPHRQFDFWVGDWNVFSVTDVLIGTNFVTLELDGCLVQEHWTGSGGGQGRSLNTYDSETGLWNQSWVSQFPFGHLRTDGGIEDGEMVLTDDDRLFPLGGGATTPIVDTWIWTPDSPDQVTQVGIFELPEFNFVSSFTGVYKRSDDVQPVAPLPSGQCQEGGPAAANRQLDFMLGAWNVSPAEGGPELATSAISTDLQDCLIEEHFSTLGPQPLQAVAFNYFDPRDGLFHRIWVDSEGERVEQSGSFEGDALVLVGAEHADGVLMLLRTTIEPGAGGFTMTNEVSPDDGATWMSALDLEYAAG